MQNRVYSPTGIATLLAALTCGSAMGQVTFRGLGVPNLVVIDMSADGSVAVATAVSLGESQAFRIAAGGAVETIGGAMGSIAISRDGRTIVGATRATPKSPRIAAVWQGGTSWKTLATLPGGIPDSVDNILSYANDVSADGSVIVGRAYDAKGKARAVRWDAGGAITDLGSFGGEEMTATAVSANGKLIGGYDYKRDDNGPPNYRRGVVWVDGTERFVHLYGWAGEVRAINDVGSVIVGEYHPMADAYGSINGAGVTGFLYTAWDGQLLNLGGIWKKGPGERGEDYSSEPSRVSDDGKVVCGQTFLAGPRAAFIWTPETGMLTLTDYLTRNGVTAHTGWAPEFVNYVSPDGKMIVGSGPNPKGIIETFIITRP